MMMPRLGYEKKVILGNVIDNTYDDGDDDYGNDFDHYNDDNCNDDDDDDPRISFWKDGMNDR